MVRPRGLEPLRVSPLASKASASTSSATATHSRVTASLPRHGRRHKRQSRPPSVGGSGSTRRCVGFVNQWGMRSVLAVHRHFFLPQSSSASRFTAGASGFLRGSFGCQQVGHSYAINPGSQSSPPGPLWFASRACHGAGFRKVRHAAHTPCDRVSKPHSCKGTVSFWRVLPSKKGFSPAGVLGCSALEPGVGG